jgi:hypothetical protein
MMNPHHSPHRVSRTLHEINHHLGSVYIHLSSDSPLWWRELCEASACIEFTSVAWATALHELIIDGALHGFHPVRSSTIRNTLSGIRHFFAATGLESSHQQVRMLLKGMGAAIGYNQAHFKL